MTKSADKQREEILEKEKAQDIFYHGVFNLENTPIKEDPIKKMDIEEVVDFYSEFEKNRTYWKDVILSMAKKLSDMNKISEVQVELYSNRQLVLEHSHYLQSLLFKVNKNYKKSLGKKWDDYITGSRKMKMGETNVLVEAATAEFKEKIDVIQSQIEYMQETIKSIDNIIYGIRYRIQLEDYRRTT